MKTLAKGILLSLGLSSMAFAGEGSQRLYEVTVTNLTKGQPLTPAVVAIHAPHTRLIQVGMPASAGFSALATDGMTDGFVQEIEATRGVVRSATGTGIILPGQSETIVVEANNAKFKASVFTMLARTNDAVATKQGMTLKLRKGQSVSYLTTTLDAGAEANTESCDHIPAPPCGNPGQGEDGEGFIRPHEGITYVGDLLGSRDAFADATASITVKRVK